MPWFIRLLFYKAPKIGDSYILDDGRNPWEERPIVVVVDVKHGWVRYKKEYTWFTSYDAETIGWFHTLYVKHHPGTDRLENAAGGESR